MLDGLIENISGVQGVDQVLTARRQKLFLKNIVSHELVPEESFDGLLLVPGVRSLAIGDGLDNLH